MPIITLDVSIQTKGFCDMKDLTGTVVAAMGNSGFRTGSVTVFVPGSTAAVTTIEYEAGALEDLAAAIERLVPQDHAYSHDRKWMDGNGFSHVRAALLGPSLTVPFTAGRLALGTWQQIILIDFDNRPRERRVMIQVHGE
ncbi:YjbQ family protein [bacterium]|nr:YjbQ family protein [candidate division CSSED10-310 bacterium]